MRENNKSKKKKVIRNITTDYQGALIKDTSYKIKVQDKAPDIYVVKAQKLVHLLDESSQKQQI